MFYDYKGDTLIMAQYEIHRSFSAEVGKTSETQADNRAHRQWANGQHCQRVVGDRRSATSRPIEYVQMRYLTLPSSIHQFMTSQGEGSERIPCPRSPRC